MPCCKRVKISDFRRRVPCPRRLGTRGQLKNLSEIGQICRIVTHCLFRCVRYLGYRLSVTAHHLHDDLQRLVAKIVGQVGTDSKRYLATAGKAAGKFDGTRKRKRVRKYQRLGPGVGTVCGVMRQQTFTPDEGIRSEEHTSELQSRENLVCRLLL